MLSISLKQPAKRLFYAPHVANRLNKPGSIYIYEPLSLGRSATDQTHKGLFATFVRSCSALRASKRPLKISYLKSACLITPFGRWNQVNPTIFEICLLYVNNNDKYSYKKFLNVKFGISALVYL